MVDPARVYARRVHGRSLLIALLLTACGGARAATADNEQPAPAPRATEAAAETETVPEAARSSTEPNLLLPFVALDAPDIPFEIATLELASEDEELAFELSQPEGELDELIEGMQEIVRGMTGQPGTVRPVTIDGREGRLLSIVGQERGRRVAIGFAIAPTADGRHARLSYQVRGQADAEAALERVLASFSTNAPGDAPAEGFRTIRIAGFTFEAPTRALVTRAALMYTDEAELEIRIAPAPRAADDGFLARATTSPLNTVRRVENVTRTATRVADAPATLATYDIVLESGPTWQERAAEATLPNGVVVFVRASRLPIDFPAVLASVRAAN